MKGINKENRVDGGCHTIKYVLQFNVQHKGR